MYHGIVESAGRHLLHIRYFITPASLTRVFEENMSPAAEQFRATDDREMHARRLVARINRGDRAALAELFGRYRHQVLSQAYRMAGNHDDAADIAQNVFLKLTRNLHRYDPQKRFYTWLYRVTMNVGIDFLRQRRRHRHEPLDGCADLLPSRQPSPEQLARHRRLVEHIRRVSNRLEARQRAILQLCLLEERSVREVAALLALSPATVRWHLGQVRDTVRRTLRGDFHYIV